MPAFNPASAEAVRPTGPAAADTSAPSLMWPCIRPVMPSSFMMNIIRSLLLPPICGPQLMPDTENGAGALHAFVLVLQVATPTPCSPPTMNAPLISLGITATHLAPSRTVLGTPRSGAAELMFCTVSVARCNSEFPAVLLSFDVDSCAHANAQKQQTSKAIANFRFLVIVPSSRFDSGETSKVYEEYFGQRDHPSG